MITRKLDPRRNKLKYLVVREADGPQASHQLENDGYTILSKAFSAHDITELSKDIDRVYTALPSDDRTNENDYRHEMLNHSSIVREVVSRREILDVIEPLLGEDCHIIANTCFRNSPKKDNSRGGGPWHIDGGPHIPLTSSQTWPPEIPHPVFAIGVHIILKDCSIECGPTGVIPRSHKSGLSPPVDQVWDDNLAWRGERTVPLTAKLGDVVLFGSDVWHRRLPPQVGDQGRWFLQVHYARRDIAQRIKLTKTVNHLDKETLTSGLSKRQELLFGLHPKGFYDG